MKNQIFLLVFLMILCVNLSVAWEYPVQEIQGKYCGSQECSIPLPKIQGGNYLFYKNNPLYRSVYSVLRGGTYFGGRDFGLGAHKGVDIASRKGTPVYSMGTGTVIFAGSKGSRGKLVSIEHEIAGQKIVSNYAHLDEILVEQGAFVTPKQLIAKIGNTGNSTGPHLHFQIDTKRGKHPYHPGNCGGETLNQNVNEARCRNLVKQNTLDPILFLETQGALFEAEQDQESDDIQMGIITLKNLNLPLRNPLFKLGDYYRYEISSTLTGILKEPLFFEGSGLQIFPQKISYIAGKRSIFIKPTFSGDISLQIKMGTQLVREISQ